MKKKTVNKSKIYQLNITLLRLISYCKTFALLKYNRVSELMTTFEMK